MYEYAEVCRILNMPPVLKMPNFCLWESSEYGRGLNMWAWHKVLNIPAYALAEFWTYLGFQICQGFKYVGVTLGFKYATAWMNMSE